MNNYLFFFFVDRNLAELSTHKKYDKNLVHGFVTINVKHQSDVEMKLKPEDERERANSDEAFIIEHDDELLALIKEEQESLSLSPPK